jgi:tetratricopeptide (TPR) repeat protein
MTPMTEQEALAALQGDDPASAARAEAGVAGDYHGAIADCRQTLARTPHHFGALSGQGLCHMALGQYREAADLFRRTLAVHPHL